MRIARPRGSIGPDAGDGRNGLGAGGGLAGRRYRAGDILTVRLTANGYRQERARIFFRNGKTPLILG